MGANGSGWPGLGAGYFGDMTIVICRPSIRGICSTFAI